MTADLLSQRQPWHFLWSYHRQTDRQKHRYITIFIQNSQIIFRVVVTWTKIRGKNRKKNTYDNFQKYFYACTLCRGNWQQEQSFIWNSDRVRRRTWRVSEKLLFETNSEHTRVIIFTVNLLREIQNIFASTALKWLRREWLRAFQSYQCISWNGRFSNIWLLYVLLTWAGILITWEKN